ncbi:PucR family transcriptional regulator [Litchfieldia salsa]|uniref:Transcriptional regulator, PucR family n=1 Tax=Litchfieldia salsa TaxID=930152 RepID=A0A1H0U912_9BACI|nr:PucR family transcriptional regulator [Litchfieldia salsa]SDP62757.1 transcriptional regulator, PucR family [Litchfieldia salsa]
MKVEEVLKVPALRGSQIIGGHSGINREVLHVNMMDAPDIISFLKPSELLVTTAYHLKDQPSLLLELIDEMANKECAALGIKTKRFLNEIPQEAIDLANKRCFPVFELPNEASLGDIVNHTLSHILDKRTNELQYAIDTHKKFTNHILSGKGIPQLLKSLSAMIGSPVILLDQYAKPIYYTKSDEKYIKPINDFNSSDDYFFFPNTPFFMFSLLRNKETYSVFSVYTHEKKAGFLLVVGEIIPNDHSTILTIEQATNVLSFELTKENVLNQHYKRVKNDFFYHFVDGEYSSQDEIVNRAKEFNLRNEQKYLCVTGELDGGEVIGSYTQIQLKIDTIYEFIEDEFKSFSFPSHLFTKGKTCTLLFELVDVTQVKTVVLPILETIQKKINSQFSRTISFGISNVSLNFFNVKNAYKEAGDALDIGKHSGKSTFIQTYRTKDIMELLRSIPRQDLKDFYNNALGGLSAREYIDDPTLLQTLYVYLETHCQISETSKRLFVHRNTVVYRLEKCEELLGKSLNDSETTLQIRLAYQIKNILE